MRNGVVHRLPGVQVVEQEKTDQRAISAWNEKHVNPNETGKSKNKRGQAAGSMGSYNSCQDYA